jgi:hypothetical protein
MLQKPDIKDLFYSLLNGNYFDTIIEFGTASGQLTHIIWEIKKSQGLPFVIHTFDLSDMGTPWNHRINAIPEINVHYKDIFKSESEIADLIINGGKTLLLCDNGNKILEFNTYSKYLKSNDVIMAHDYSPSNSFWENNKHWPVLEIEDKDIIDSINNNELITYQNDFTLTYGWCCFKKI